MIHADLQFQCGKLLDEERGCHLLDRLCEELLRSRLTSQNRIGSANDTSMATQEVPPTMRLLRRAMPGSTKCV